MLSLSNTVVPRCCSDDCAFQRRVVPTSESVLGGRGLFIDDGGFKLLHGWLDSGMFILAFLVTSAACSHHIDGGVFVGVPIDRRSIVSQARRREPLELLTMNSLLYVGAMTF